MPYFRDKPNPLVSKAVIAALSLNMLSPSVLAADGDPQPVPTTFTDVSVPQLTGWNDANIATLDGATGATAKSHVYASEAAKDDPLINSLAAIYWELDNGTGRAPGVQVVTDDLDFPTNNCIMASGEIESEDFPGTIVPKTCSDGEGSSKRYFFELTSADVPIDLAFDLGVKDIRYKGVKDPATDGGEELDEFRDTYGFGRIYRVIQKVINNTDKRIASYKFELGTGLGAAFVPLTINEGVAFEMRTSVPREFFEGETGAPDISVWNPQRFATFSPKMFDDGARARFEPGFISDAPAGFLPPQIPAAGVEKASVIDSGTTSVNGIVGSLTANYFDVQTANSVIVPGNVFGYMLPDSLIPAVIGQYSTNEIGGESDAIVAIWDGTDWRAGQAGLDIVPAVAPYGVIPPSQLTQWAGKQLGLNLNDGISEGDPAFVRYDTLLSDDLSGLNTDMFIYIDDKLLDQNGDLIYDSITLRVTANSVDSLGMVPGTEDPEWKDQWENGLVPSLASYLAPTGVPVAFNDAGTTEETDPVTLAILDNDLLDGAAVVPADGTITVGPAANGGVVINGDNTVTYTANLGFTGTELISYTYTLTATGEVSNSATIKVVVEAAPIPDAPIANNDSATTFKNTDIILNVLANDELNNMAPGTVVVSIDNAALNGVATVIDADDTISYAPGANFVGFERFTYQVTVDGKVSNSALITVRVDEPVVEEPAPPVYYKKSSSSGCSVGNSNAPFDPILPAMFLLALAGLWMRRNKQGS